MKNQTVQVATRNQKGRGRLRWRGSRLQVLFATACGLAFFGQVSAMSFADLQQAVENASDGDVVYVRSDVTYDGVLNVGGKRLVISSPEGEQYVLTRDSGYAGRLLTVGQASAKVTLQNVVIDGNRADGVHTDHILSVTDGNLVLGRGVIFRNAESTSSPGPIFADGVGELTMEDGAEIRGCVNSQWGVAVLIQNAAQFVMRGGLITECVGMSQKGADYDGVVYVSGASARFSMMGGTITGNTSSHSIAGVVAYNGCFAPGGSACITNNIGGYANDVYVNPSKGSLVFNTKAGDYTGHMTVHVQSEPVLGGSVYSSLRAWCDQYTPGLGLGCVVCEQWPQYVMDGRTLLDGWYPHWVIRTDIENRGISGSYNEVMERLQDGDVVVLNTNETAATATIDAGMHITVRGNGHRLVRESGVPLFIVENASLRLENITLDGNRPTVINTGDTGMITVLSKGEVSLGAATVIENAQSSSTTAAVGLRGAGSILNMEDGAIIRNCSLSRPDGYAVAVRVGMNEECDPLPVFRMSGGAITGNVAQITRDPSDGFGGTVYCYNGNFEMSGGTISQNVCKESSSGVNVYQGHIAVSGTARIENNIPSIAPDVYLCTKWSGVATASMEGDFRGHVGVSSCENQNDVRTGFTSKVGNTGACRFFSARGTPYGAKSAYLYTNGHIYLYEAAAWIDGIGWPQWGAGGYVYEDMSTLLPSVVDLDNEKDRAVLPHTFKGEAALAYSGSMEVKFDSAAWMGSSELPLTILKAEEGSFKGSWRFVTPDAEKGRWKVRGTFADGKKVAYALNWRDKLGFAISVK